MYRNALWIWFGLVPLLAFGQQADSEPAVFDVEIIVFRHLNADQAERMVDRVASATDSAATPAPAPRRVRSETLPPAALRLGDINERLMRSSEWSPILHAGWRQPVESRESAGAMPVAGSRRGAYVSGTARMSLERFLRLELDLQLDDGSGESYRLEQARRLRSGQVHYFDHPQFGVIVLVSRTD